MSAEESTVYLNGDYLPLEEARVSVLDRGFLFGDGVYEVIPVYGQSIFRRTEHLERLDHSLGAIEMRNPWSRREWESLIDSVLSRNSYSEQRSVYIQVTRGAGERNHLYDEHLDPTVFIQCRPLITSDYSGGLSAITHPDIRWAYCHIKAITLLPNVMLRNLARRSGGAHEAILLREGEVTEAAASNVFVVHGDRVKTPATGNRLLSGITRNLVVELLQEAGIDCRETKVTIEDLHSADEIWLTSSTMEVAPVIELDGKRVGKGTPGGMWRRIRALYEAFKQDLKSHQAATDVSYYY